MADRDAIRNHAADRRLFLRRTLVAGVLLLVLLGLLVARIAYLQIYKHQYYETRSQDNRMRVEAMAPVRGLIRARHGKLLAGNVPSYQLMIVPEQVQGKVDEAIRELSEFLPITSSDRKRFHKLAQRKALFLSTPILTHMSQDDVAKFEVNRQRFPGVNIQATLTRTYPDGDLMAHVVGYVGSITQKDLFSMDNKRYRGSSQIGKVGVEKSYESELHGYPGSRVVEINAAGRPLRQLDTQPATAGDNITLTLDSGLQKLAYDALGDHEGAVVALDPKTGGVLALVSKPSFDPNLFVGGISQSDYSKLMNPKRPLYNRALQGQYPPGSTIKPFMAIAALETGVIDPDKKVWCPGYITLPGSSHRYRDWKRSGQGWINLTQAIERSSDVYFYKLGMKLGIDNIHKYDTIFGFGRRTGIDLPRENSGVAPSPAWKHAHKHLPWYPGETLITTIGQGYMTVTPLQLAQATSMIAERGHAFRPHVLKSWVDPKTGKEKVYQPEPLPPIELKDKRHWDIVINAMKGVVNAPRGTAYRYVGRPSNHMIAGKSGSAQVTSLPQNEVAPDLSSIPYRLREHALFIAFAPIKNPKIAVAVIVEHGGGGSSVAGPIARQVIDHYLDGLQDRDDHTQKASDADKEGDQ